METIDEPLVKIVPRGEPVSPYSPFFARQSAFEDAIARGHNLSDYFGLPIRSEAQVYDIHQIRPNAPTEVFVNSVAPTSELDGRVTKAGGAEQYLVPNRRLFSESVRVGSIGNDLSLHQQLVASRGLGPSIAAISSQAPEHVRAPRLGNASRALGIAGAAATAYDIADTAHDVSQLRGQGNNTAAAARIERFATQNLAGWSGAAAGVSAGAAMGVETGPGLLVTGAVGGIIGAVAGDKVADWIEQRRINQQQDDQGRTWTFDPAHPENGWVHQQRVVDVEAMRHHTLDSVLYRTRTLTADPALSDRLTFQASATSIELALGSPPSAQDPYTQAAGAQDIESARQAPWTRDPQTRQWTREVSTVTDYHGNQPAYTTHPMTANPQRAVELEQQAQAVVAHNATRTPAAMAARFESAYQENGWSQHGPLPEAVIMARRQPGRLVGSDGDLYQRDAQGQWTHDGLLWDNQAKGNLQQELEATYQRQQADNHIPTLETVRVQPEPAINAAQAASPRDRHVVRFLAALETGDENGMREASMAFAGSERGQQMFVDAEQRQWDRQQQLPDREQPLFQQALGHLQREGPEKCGYVDRLQMENMAGALALQARTHHLRDIEQVLPGRDGTLLANGQHRLHSAIKPQCSIDIAQAGFQPLQQSLPDLAAETQRQEQHSVQLEQQRQMQRGAGLAR